MLPPIEASKSETWLSSWTPPFPSSLVSNSSPRTAGFTSCQQKCAFSASPMLPSKNKQSALPPARACLGGPLPHQSDLITPAQHPWWLPSLSGPGWHGSLPFMLPVISFSPFCENSCRSDLPSVLSKCVLFPHRAFAVHNASLD